MYLPVNSPLTSASIGDGGMTGMDGVRGRERALGTSGGGWCERVNVPRSISPGRMVMDADPNASQGSVICYRTNRFNRPSSSERSSDNRGRVD